MKKRRLKDNFIRIFIIIAVLSFAGYLYIMSIMPNFNVEPFYKYIPDWNEGEISILLEDVPIDNETPVIKKDDNVYMPVDFIMKYMDEFIFCEDENVILTTPDTIFRFKIDEREYTINNESDILPFAITKINNITYFPTQFIEQFYHFNLYYADSTKILMIDYKDREHTITSVKAKRSNIRFEPTIKAAIAEKTIRDSELFVFEEQDKWVKVRTDSGIVGYIPKKDITDFTVIPSVEKLEVIIEPMWKPEKGKINLVWVTKLLQ